MKVTLRKTRWYLYAAFLTNPVLVISQDLSYSLN